MRWRRRLVRFGKKPSTAFSQEDDVGMRWNLQCGWRTSHPLTVRCLWVGIVVDEGLDRVVSAETDSMNQPAFGKSNIGNSL